MINASETDSYLQLQIAREGHPRIWGQGDCHLGGCSREFCTLQDFFLEFEAEQPSKGMIMSRRSLFKIQKITNLDNSFLLFQIKKSPASTPRRVLIGLSSTKKFIIDRSSSTNGFHQKSTFQSTLRREVFIRSTLARKQTSGVTKEF